LGENSAAKSVACSFWRHPASRNNAYGRWRRLVSAGPNLYLSGSDASWHAFLYDHLQLKLGVDWFWDESSKPVGQMHLLVRWFRDLCAVELDEKCQFTRWSEQTDTGSALAFRSLAYDVWCLEQHSCFSQPTLERLKSKDGFEGARYEIWVAACFTRAGFEIAFEDETDRRRSHYEFVATLAQTGAMYSVEVKRRHRLNIDHARVFEEGQKLALDIAGLISAALRKHADYQRIVFIDINMPPLKDRIVDEHWAAQFRATKETLEMQTPFKGPAAPNAFILATNHPYHYVGATKPDPRQHLLATSFNFSICLTFIVIQV
jgi:hypothetical protein